MMRSTNQAKKCQEFFFVNKYSQRSLLASSDKDESQLRHQFIQRGRRHKYPDTIF